MAECHPVGFQWVMEAKARGATVIHVDPRFTRTSAVADLHVPLRAGSDIAFVGGIINYVLQNEKYFSDYVLAYTNAATIVSEEFADTEDLDGVFSGLDRENRVYDFRTWQYEGMEVQAASGERDVEYDDKNGASGAGVREAARGEAHGSGGAAIGGGTPERDETLTHPRCVFQVLKRHFARYTPELVEQVCGIAPAQFARVCELLTENSGRDKTSAFVYSVGWTQHTVGVQYVRTAAILQALLGNIGRPGGGILALRGHASIQGSTDIPTLFDLLPGYIPMPHAHSNEDLDSFVKAEADREGLLGQHARLHRQPAEGVVGPGRHGRERLLLRLPAAADREPQHLRDRHGPAGRPVQGLLPAGREPGRRLGQREAAATRHGEPGLARGQGLLADRERDLVEGRAGDRDRRDAHGGHRDRGVLPARRGAHREERQLHQHPADAAVASPGGRARRGQPQRPVVHVPPRPPDPRQAESGSEFCRRDEPADPGPHLGLPDVRTTRGAFRRCGTRGDQRLDSGRQAAVVLPGTGRRRIDGLRLLDLLRRLCRRREPGRPAQAKHRAGLGRGPVGLGLAREPPDPLQPGVGRPRRQPVERAQGAGVVGRGERHLDRPRRRGLRS